MFSEIVPLIISSFTFVGLAYGWICEIRFYRKNGWNMGKNRPDRISDFDEGDWDPKVSNWNNLTFNYPLCIALNLLFVIITAAHFFGR